MKCPKCQAYNYSKAVDSRPAKNYIRRRRECLKCGERFTSHEKRVVTPCDRRRHLEQQCLNCGLLSDCGENKKYRHVKDGLNCCNFIGEIDGTGD